ncbi:DUF6777 domain-containing protein [Streptomyces sp. NPDC003038]|uniref:DUF6777 domain-containing protein n=1 Tax=unclassified Streptomyces TaxID=2593676 RepID=UPI0033ACBB31
MALVVVLTRPNGASDSAGGEVFLQPAAASGPDPFTESTAAAATQATPPPASPPPTVDTTQGTTVTRSVSGAAPGVYGGTKDVASCDVEKQIKVLAAQPAKNSAFALVLGIGPTDVPGYLRSLTPVQLRMDTRVTNHGYKEGRATAYQAVLQAGTAVLVDGKGVPRVRCACGNPLREPVPLKPNSKRYGQPWTAYHPQNVVVIAPSVKIINKIVIYDHKNRRWYERDRGAKPATPDKPIAPPAVPTPTYSTPPAVPTPTYSTPPVIPAPTYSTPPVISTPPPTSPTESDIPTDTPTDAPTDAPTATPATSPAPPAPTDRTATSSEPATPSPPDTQTSGAEPSSEPPPSEPASSAAPTSPSP